ISGLSGTTQVSSGIQAAAIWCMREEGKGNEHTRSAGLVRVLCHGTLEELDKGREGSTGCESFGGKLKGSRVPCEVHIYPGCGHAFMSKSPEGGKRRKSMGMNDEDEGAVELAWSCLSPR
ncbi:hypothetical protein Ancab_010913, partial [Ancistrocladus abbreviatus]